MGGVRAQYEGYHGRVTLAAPLLADLRSCRAHWPDHACSISPPGMASTASLGKGLNSGRVQHQRRSISGRHVLEVAEENAQKAERRGPL